MYYHYHYAIIVTYIMYMYMFYISFKYIYIYIYILEASAALRAASLLVPHIGFCVSLHDEHNRCFAVLLVELRNVGACGNRKSAAL